MDIFKTQVLAKVIESLDQPGSHLLNTYFPDVQNEESEEIHFDVDESKPRIAPFCSPMVAGRVLIEDGYKTNTFKPAYVKDKRVFNPNAPFKRRAGEQIGGTLTAGQRREAALNASIVNQLNRLTRREELMAAQAMLTGSVTVAGDDYPTTVVDFGRDAALTVALGGGVKWSDSGIDVLDNLEDWAGVIQTKSGAISTTVTMDPKAWRLFKKNSQVEKYLDFRRGTSNTMNADPVARGKGMKARYMGSVGEFDFWVYQDTYVDENDATQQMLPDYSVILGGPDVEGTRCYGSIHDEKANYTALRYFIKSWLEEDPAVRYLLLQSAPLVVPYRVNATGCWTVA